ncbi:MAG: 2-C-methyl-D-erythritol 4-phosphate cytidylyltransferase [Erysipelotrichaceae bacterium]|nr:2-C-methyl-D-erythritol 4-phosphate cytidylyltransferase [Erysipelotrichaceae bacterium]
MYSVIILCAGKGTRSGLDYNKMLFKFNNKTVYEMTLDHFINDKYCGQIIVVTQLIERDIFKDLVTDERIEFVDGGKERQDSVYNGLQMVKYPYVLIHDGARPYVKDEHVQALLECLKQHKACLLMVPCKDTIKRVKDNKIVETLNRSELMQAQTPQAFHTDVIKDAYQKAIDNHYQATDDAQMVEKFSDEDIYVVLGDYDNLKITTPEDLRVNHEN